MSKISENDFMLLPKRTRAWWYRNEERRWKELEEHIYKTRQEYPKAHKFELQLLEDRKMDLALIHNKIQDIKKHREKSQLRLDTPIEDELGW